MQNIPPDDPNGHAEIAELKERLKTLEDQLRGLVETRERERSGEQTTQLYIQDLFARMNREIGGLRGEIRTIHQEIGGIHDATRHNSHNIAQILHSRIWRALRFAGALALNAGSLGLRAASRVRREPSSGIELCCDEPQASDRTPRRGVIQVRGWALSSSGIDHVDIQIDSQPPLRAEYGLPRPDVVRHGFKGGGRSGFELTIDPALLPRGERKISVEAVTCSGQVKRVVTSVLIDRAFASDYDRWIAEFEEAEGLDIRSAMDCFQLRPLISILMPVYRTSPKVLKLAIESVRKQTYGNWELCLADDASGLPELDATIEEFARTDPRIMTVKRTSRGGISAASNSALKLAGGEFVGMLDHDDELAPDALFHVVEAINRQPNVGLLYSDEDKLDANGRRRDPFFKPDWSPDLLLSQNYVSHFSVCRRDLVEQAGGFRPEYDGSQDYDLILRVSRLTREIVHIPRVLYHWRSSPGSTAVNSSNKPECVDAARRAIEDHLRSAQIAASVQPGRYPGVWRVRYECPAAARVTILIPSGGKVEVLRTNLDQLAAKTDYRNYEILIVDNSRGSEIEQFVRRWTGNGRTAGHLDCRDMPFNWSALNNEAVRHCDSELMLFLNDDTEVITPDWLTAMVELGIRPEVGVVGAKLLYPDRRIQHAGVIMGPYENCGHAFKGLSGDKQYYFDFPDVIRNVSAVTGACLMARRDVFWQAGGFDEERFAVAFNDIDFCLKVGRAGYRVLYTPHAILYHYESFSKTGEDLEPRSTELSGMRTRWKQAIGYDPYYNPNLTRRAEDYGLGTRRWSTLGKPI